MIPKKRKEYLRTTKVSSWLVISAVLILLVVFIVWAFIGNMLELQRIKVISGEDGIYGYVDVAYADPAKLKKGMEIVLADGGKGTIGQIDHYVYTLEEIRGMYDASLLSQLDAGEYGLIFSIEIQESEGMSEIQDGWIIVDEIKPVSLWFAGEEK